MTILGLGGGTGAPSDSGSGAWSAGGLWGELACFLDSVEVIIPNEFLRSGLLGLLLLLSLFMSSVANFLGEEPGDRASNISISDVTLGRPEEEVEEEEEEEEDTFKETSSVSFLCGTFLPPSLSGSFLVWNSELLERFRNNCGFNMSSLPVAKGCGCGLWEGLVEET